MAGLETMPWDLGNDGLLDQVLEHLIVLGVLWINKDCLPVVFLLVGVAASVVFKKVLDHADKHQEE